MKGGTEEKNTQNRTPDVGNDRKNSSAVLLGKKKLQMDLVNNNRHSGGQQLNRKLASNIYTQVVIVKKNNSKQIPVDIINMPKKNILIDLKTAQREDI